MAAVASREVQVQDRAGHQPPQPDTRRRRARPSGLLRLALRLPIVLYHLRLGWLLDHRILLLTNVGRRSGQARKTALEVVRYEPEHRRCVVVSAWGEQADWYRNLRAHPGLEVRIGRERFAPTRQFLTTDEAYAELLDYERRHPRLFKLIAAWMGFPVDRSQDARRDLAEAVRLVALQPELPC